MKHEAVEGPAVDDLAELPPSITLALMPQQQGEVRSAADDWTGIVDRAARRRLQNRLNQRAYRKSAPPETQVTGDRSQNRRK
jgi:hypothetical protein